MIDDSQQYYDFLEKATPEQLQEQIDITLRFVKATAARQHILLQELYPLQQRSGTLDENLRMARSQIEQMTDRMIDRCGKEGVLAALEELC